MSQNKKLNLQQKLRHLEKVFKANHIAIYAYEIKKSDSESESNITITLDVLIPRKPPQKKI